MNLEEGALATSIIAMTYELVDQIVVNATCWENSTADFKKKRDALESW
jgi:hypothetical protein